MTETATSQTIQATPLAALLGATAAPPALHVYRGMLTPQQLDAPEREIEAFVSSAAVHDLGWRCRIAVRGEDRSRWLNGMVTNMVKDLAPNSGAWNLVLNAQGRIQGDLTVWRDGDAFELEIAADQREKLLAHFERFIIMDDVELLPVEGQSALGLTGPHAAGVLEKLGLPEPSAPMSSVRADWNGYEVLLRRGYGVLAPHFELWIAVNGLERLWRTLKAAGASPAGAGSLESFRIAEGIPAYGIDIAERDLPQETSQMRALHFEKGCYLGQEIVERIRSRGNVHRHLRQVELAGSVPAPGTELTLQDGASAGQVTSAAEVLLPSGPRVFALAMIRGEAELRSQPLNYPAGTAKLLAAPPSTGPARN